MTIRSMFYRSLVPLFFSLLAGCCCPGPSESTAGSTANTAQRATATQGALRIVSAPPADVWVDGASLGLSPVDVALAPGEHSVRVRLGGFEVHGTTVAITGGTEQELRVALVLIDAEEREGLQLLADAALPEHDRLWVQTFEAQPPNRGEGDGQQVRVLFPRGSVRPADLRRFRVEFAAGAKQAGAVEFRRGGKVLHRIVVKPDDARDLEGQVPTSVSKLLTAGDQVTWGFYPTKGAPHTTQFKVVDKNLQQAIATIGKVFEGQPQAAAAHIRSQLLLNNGLYYAAYQEAQGVLTKDKGSIRAWAVVLEALKHMGIGQSSRAWRQAQTALAGKPQAVGQQIRFMAGSDVRRVDSHLAAGDAGRALSTLRGQLKAGGTPGPLQLRGLALTAASNASVMAQKAPGASGKFVAEIQGLVTKAHEQGADVNALHWATAYLSIAEGRIRAHAGQKPGAAHWLDAVAEIEPALADQADAASGYMQAVRWLHEAALLPGIDPKPVVARADELAKTLTLRFPERSAAAIATASTHMLRMRLDPKMKRKALRTTVQACVEALQPHLATENPEPAVGTLHTQAVTFAKKRKLGLKLGYRVIDVAGEHGLLEFTLPLSERWLPSDDPLGSYIVFIRNLDEDGALQRVVTVSTFDWYVPYSFRNARTTSGENASALSKLSLGETLARFGKVRKKRASHVRRLSKRFKRAHHYDVLGETRSGDFLHIRSWVVKSKEHKKCYHVTIQTLAEDLPAMDPELSFVLESLRDMER